MPREFDMSRGFLPAEAREDIGMEAVIFELSNVFGYKQWEIPKLFVKFVNMLMRQLEERRERQAATITSAAARSNGTFPTCLNVVVLNPY